jgi:TRAP transporter TAXI family solute receptor
MKSEYKRISFTWHISEGVGVFPASGTRTVLRIVLPVLVVHADMDENLVYEITKALFTHRTELIAIHPEAANLSLESAVKDSPVPFHPGAIRYYKEQHVWPE